MNRILLIANVALVVVVAVVYSLLRGEEKNNRQLSRTVAELRAKEAAAAAAVTRADPHEVCRAQITQLTSLLSNSAYQLEITQKRLNDYEEQTAAILASVEAGPTSVTVTASQPTGTNTMTRPTTPQRFELLADRNGQVLGRNLEYSAVYGRRVAFKEIDSSTRVAFDVEQLDPQVLARLGIDVEAQKALHARQEVLWRRAEAASLALAAAEQQKRQERLAAAAAARAEAERQRAEQLFNQANAIPDRLGDQTSGPPAGPEQPSDPNPRPPGY